MKRTHQEGHLLSESTRFGFAGGGMGIKLGHDVVQRLGSSRFNYWFGYVANGAWVLFFLLQIRADAPASRGTLMHPLWQFIAGMLLWTLLEYLLHRFVYHVIPSCLSDGHRMHHAAPRELIGVPWWLTSVLLLLVHRALLQLFSAPSLGAVLAGVWTGYIVYCLLHHGTHHWPMRGRYLRQVKQLHQLHHVYPEMNWGFTTHLWDVVFGTYLSVAAARCHRRPERPVSVPHSA